MTGKGLRSIPPTQEKITLKMPTFISVKISSEQIVLLTTKVNIRLKDFDLFDGFSIRANIDGNHPIFLS